MFGRCFRIQKCVFSGPWTYFIAAVSNCHVVNFQAGKTILLSQLFFRLESIWEFENLTKSKKREDCSSNGGRRREGSTWLVMQLKWQPPARRDLSRSMAHSLIFQNLSKWPYFLHGDQNPDALFRKLYVIFVMPLLAKLDSPHLFQALSLLSIDGFLDFQNWQLR